ncbi:MAG: hypothetical protein ABIT36_12520 [Steroidobacteraceae bacterium]
MTEQQEPQLLSAFAVKIAATLERLETNTPEFVDSAFDIDPVAIGCALSYADYRFDSLDWRNDHPRLTGWHRQFEARRFALATRPSDD